MAIKFATILFLGFFVLQTQGKSVDLTPEVDIDADKIPTLTPSVVNVKVNKLPEASLIPSNPSATPVPVPVPVQKPVPIILRTVSLKGPNKGELVAARRVWPKEKPVDLLKPERKALPRYYGQPDYYDDSNNYGYAPGYDYGYDTGYDYGYDTGYDYGYDPGYDNGYDNAYDIGYDAPVDFGQESLLRKVNLPYMWARKVVTIPTDEYAPLTVRRRRNQGSWRSENGATFDTVYRRIVPGRQRKRYLSLTEQRPVPTSGRTIIIERPPKPRCADHAPAVRELVPVVLNQQKRRSAPAFFLRTALETQDLPTELTVPAPEPAPEQESTKVPSDLSTDDSPVEFKPIKDPEPITDEKRQVLLATNEAVLVPVSTVVGYRPVPVATTAFNYPYHQQQAVYATRLPLQPVSVVKII